MNRAVFLDRDDTLIANRSVTADTDHPGDLFDPDLVRLLPGVGAACRALTKIGFALVVVSNQGAVARGRCSIEQVEACNERLRSLLLAEGTELARIYYCPHHPLGAAPPYNTEHPWRKPAPGMILAARRELDLDLARCWLVGDAPRDLEAAAAAGIPPEQAILIGERAGAACPTLAEAASRIVRAEAARSTNEV